MKIIVASVCEWNKTYILNCYENMQLAMKEVETEFPSDVLWETESSCSFKGVDRSTTAKLHCE